MQLLREIPAGHERRTQFIQLNACALIPGDIAPGRDIAGEVVIRGAGAETVRVIYSASRARNPDGTVNYTQLELV